MIRSSALELPHGTGRLLVTVNRQIPRKVVEGEHAGDGIGSDAVDSFFHSLLEGLGFGWHSGAAARAHVRWFRSGIVASSLWCCVCCCCFGGNFWGAGCIKIFKKSGSRNQCSPRRSKMTWSEARRSAQRSSDERGFCTPNLQFCYHEKADDNGKANPPPLAHVLEQFSACAYHYDPTNQLDNIATSKMKRGPSN
jgi:hypothetical protein